MLDKQAVAKSFSMAANEYDEYARVQHHVAKQLLDKLPKLNTADHQIQTVVDVGCGTGYCLPSLAEKYPTAKIIGADLAPGMLDYAKQHYPQFDYQIADAESLPFSAASIDLVFSNFAVQWCDQFSQVLQQIKTVLKPNGYVLLSTLAEGTLSEVKRAWQSVDSAQHVNNFESIESLQHAVNNSGLLVHSMTDYEYVEYYSELRGLTDSLKRIGAHNVTEGRSKGLTSRQKVKQFKQAMEQFRSAQGLPARYNVFTVLLQHPL